jgi:hypothetical protein
MVPATLRSYAAQAQTIAQTVDTPEPPPSGNCGPYSYRLITNSNGYNTYVANDKWGCGSPDQCGLQTVQATSPGNWQVTSKQAAGNTAVLTYPDVQQLFTHTTGNDPPISSFHAVYSHFAEAMHATAGTDAEAGYDIWLSHTKGPSEVMVWVDNHGRGSGGATRIGQATIFGQSFTVYRYGGGEIIFSLDHNEQTGTVHILASLRWLQGHGYVSAGAGIGQVDLGGRSARPGASRRRSRSAPTRCSQCVGPRAVSEPRCAPGAVPISCDI